MFRTIAWRPKLLTSGSETPVRSKPKQIAPRERESRRANGGPEEARDRPFRNVVREIQLPQLDVGAALHVGLGEPLPEAIDAIRPGGHEVLAVRPGVVQKLGQVDDVTALLVVPQHAEGEAVEIHVAGERHLVIRVGVADLARDRVAGRVGSDQTEDLRGRAALFDLEGAEREREAAGLEGGHRQLGDLAPTGEERGAQNPVHVLALHRLHR